GDFIDMRPGSLNPPPPPKTLIFPMTPPPAKRALSPPTTRTPTWPTPPFNPNRYKVIPTPSPIWRAQGRAEFERIGRLYLPKAPPIIVPEDDLYRHPEASGSG
ncbi:MAG: hypothetical protein ACKPKO_23415, partial [Candidatus Fonsibacter sp.]